MQNLIAAKLRHVKRIVASAWLTLGHWITRYGGSARGRTLQSSEDLA